MSDGNGSRADHVQAVGVRAEEKIVGARNYFWLQSGTRAGARKIIMHADRDSLLAVTGLDDEGAPADLAQISGQCLGSQSDLVSRIFADHNRKRRLAVVG